MIDMTRFGKYIQRQVLESGLTCLRNDDPFQLAFGEALPWHLRIPCFVEMRCTLKNPYQTQYYIAECENKDGDIERSDECLGDCDAQKKQTDGYLGECQSRKGL